MTRDKKSVILCVMAIIKTKNLRWRGKHMNIEGYTHKIAAGDSHTVWIKPDGTVGFCGSNKKRQCNVSAWRDIVSIACGKEHTVGLRADGTVLACGSDFWGQCQVSGWRDIVAIACGWGATIAVRRDGVVCYAGYGVDAPDRAALNGADHISHGDGFAVVVKKGYARPYGSSLGGRTKKVSGWTNVIQVASGLDHTAAVTVQGTVEADGYGFYNELDTGNWRNIVAVECGRRHTVGLCKDGTVVACGETKPGQCEVSGWRNIVEIACGSHHTVGRTATGELVACGVNKAGQCDVASARTAPSQRPGSDIQSAINAALNSTPKREPVAPPPAPTRPSSPDPVLAEQLRQIEEQRAALEAERRRVEEETARLRALEAERAELERAERERAERERAAKEAEERERVAREAEERERVAREAAEKEKKAKSAEDAELEFLRSFVRTTGSSRTTRVREESPEFIFASNSNGITVTSYTGNAEEVTIPATVGDEPVTEIGENCFAYNQTVRRVYFNATEIERVGAFAFAFCPRLEAVIISDELAYIGESAFEGDESLYAVTSDPDEENEVVLRVFELGARVFKNCISITSVFLDMSRFASGVNSPISIGDEVFANCTGVRSMTFHFESSHKSSTVGDRLFFGCSSLRDLRLGVNKDVRSLGDGTFDGCTSLENVYIDHGARIARQIKQLKSGRPTKIHYN